MEPYQYGEEGMVDGVEWVKVYEWAKSGQTADPQTPGQKV